MKSRFFVLQLLWLSIMQLRHYLFIGTLNPMLQRLTAGEPSLGKHACRSEKTFVQTFLAEPVKLYQFRPDNLAEDYTNKKLLSRMQ